MAYFSCVVYQILAIILNVLMLTPEKLLYNNYSPLANYCYAPPNIKKICASLAKI